MKELSGDETNEIFVDETDPNFKNAAKIWQKNMRLITDPSYYEGLAKPTKLGIDWISPKYKELSTSE